MTLFSFRTNQGWEKNRASFLPTYLHYRRPKVVANSVDNQNQGPRSMIMMEIKGIGAHILWVHKESVMPNFHSIQNEEFFYNHHTSRFEKKKKSNNNR